MSEEPHRVLVVDDHPIFREGLIDVFRTAPDIEVVGQAATADAAVEAIRTCKPTIVVIDLFMPRSDGERTTDSGLEAIRRIKEEAPDIRILVVSSYEDNDLVQRAMAAGANGYCPKQSTSTEILAASRFVGNGGLAFAAPVAEWARAEITRPRPRTRPLPELNDGEYQIALLVIRGWTNAGIAAHLHLSPRTIANKLTTIFEKLGVTNRQELIRRAREEGIDDGLPVG